MTANDPAPILETLRRMAVIGAMDVPDMEPLAGGVSSDIWRVDLLDGPVCVKRALSRLKVAKVWKAPIERNHYEAEWMRFAARRLPQAVPRLIGEDRDSGTLVMAYLTPDRHPLWKNLLRDGDVEPAFAGQVGVALAKIHGANANNTKAARAFATDDIFRAIRLEPYLLATAARHPDVAHTLTDLARCTAETRITLVHGDISPKNILRGPDGPIFLDAECAWYGDPAFDLAFCLNHLLLKCLWRPVHAAGYMTCFSALAEAYLDSVGWESVNALERRTASLLPALFLARIDGKSPVEYLTKSHQKDRVRRVAIALLQQRPAWLADIATAWQVELAS